MIQKSVGCSIVPIKGELRYLLLSMSARRDKERSRLKQWARSKEWMEKRKRDGANLSNPSMISIAINDPVVCVCIEVNKAPGAKGNT